MTQHLTILYAEDDPDIQMIASMALEDIGGFNVYLCNNGEEAVQLVTTRQVKPNLILLDVMMPQKDGPTALLELQSAMGSELPPVVFITAKASASEVERLIALGAHSVITKPFDPMTLADEVASCWENASRE